MIYVVIDQTEGADDCIQGCIQAADEDQAIEFFCKISAAEASDFEEGPLMVKPFVLWNRDDMERMS